VTSVFAASEADDATLDIVNKYLDATKVQQAALRGCQMDVDIDAKLPRLEKQGKLRALRIVSRLGQIIYKGLDFTGDNTIKKEVIARYLEAESQARDDGSMAISPENYKFRLKAKLTQNENVTYIFQLTPKKKRQGLFKGELWLDAATGMPVRESGQLVKNPSVFLKKVEFVREYQLENGVALPSHIESTVDTRIAGKAELSINFSHFTHEHDVDEESIAH
jgi:hypothetical protein